MRILHNFSTPRTPQQNWVVERKNRSLEELARTMLNESSLPKYFWADAVSTSCYVMNKVLIRPIMKKTPYELFNGRKPNINHLRVFGCSCFVLKNGKENLGKFDEKADLGIFIGYSLTSHAYRIYNKRLMTVEESVHVVFDEVDRRNIQIPKTSAEEDEQSISLEKWDISAEKQPIDSQKQPIEIMQQSELPNEWRIPRDLSVENIIGQIKEGVSTRSSISNFCRHTSFVSQIEPKSIDEALKDEKWVEAMHEELNQFARNEVKQTKDEIFLCQSKYCKEILKKFEMESYKEANTPMPSSCYMDANAVGKGVDQTKYRELIGSLLCLTASRPDIMFGVCLCARYQANPKESHFKAAKRILKYLKGTSTVGLWYPSHSPIHLIGYSDSDFAGCKLDRKSTSGTCHLLGSSLISWHSKKQICVALSTTEAEYIAVGSCCAQILWLKQQLANFGLQISKVPLMCDNTSAINLTKNQIQHSRTKYIEIRHHFIRDHVSNGIVK